MPRKTDSNSPADWIYLSEQDFAGICERVYFMARYPGFDLEDPDWITFGKDVSATRPILEQVKARTQKQKAESRKRKST